MATRLPIGSRGFSPIEGLAVVIHKLRVGYADTRESSADEPSDSHIVPPIAQGPEETAENYRSGTRLITHRAHYPR
jgi:hypothetical protein